MMHPLYESFPETVLVDGRPYHIRTDFRYVLRLIDTVEENPDEQECLAALLFMYDEEIPYDLEAAIYAISNFILGKEESPREGEKDEEEDRKKTLSFSKDAPFIAGDFLRFYQMDLTRVKYLHWKKFQFLLDGLPEESETKKRIAYRAMDAGKIKDKHERERILRIQRNIALEDTEADAGRIGELFGGLMG